MGNRLQTWIGRRSLAKKLTGSVMVTSGIAVTLACAVFAVFDFSTTRARLVKDVTTMRGRYAELLSDALKIDVAPANYLADIDSGFYVSSYLRSWAFEAQLRAYLKEKFGSKWFATHQAGSLQNADVLRHRVERHGKGPGKLRDAQFCLHHALEYCPTYGMSQRREGEIEVLLPFIQLHGLMIIRWGTAVKEPGQTGEYQPWIVEASSRAAGLPLPPQPALPRRQSRRAAPS